MTFAAEPQNFITLDQGTTSAVESRGFFVVRNEQKWKELWSLHRSRRTPVAHPPPIDFAKEMIVAVFSGNRLTGGYRVEIVSIEETQNQLIVQLRESKPPPGSSVIQILSSPYHIVKLNKTSASVVFAVAP